MKSMQIKFALTVCALVITAQMNALSASSSASPKKEKRLEVDVNTLVPIQAAPIYFALAEAYHQEAEALIKNNISRIETRFNNQDAQESYKLAYLWYGRIGCAGNNKADNPYFRFARARMMESCLLGLGVPKDHEKALNAAKSLSQQQQDSSANKLATVRLGQMQALGFGMQLDQKSFTEGLETLRRMVLQRQNRYTSDLASIYIALIGKMYSQKKALRLMHSEHPEIAVLARYLNIIPQLCNPKLYLAQAKIIGTHVESLRDEPIHQLPLSVQIIANWLLIYAHEKALELWPPQAGIRVFSKQQTIQLYNRLITQQEVPYVCHEMHMISLMMPSIPMTESSYKEFLKRVRAIQEHAPSFTQTTLARTWPEVMLLPEGENPFLTVAAVPDYLEHEFYQACDGIVEICETFPIIKKVSIIVAFSIALFHDLMAGICPDHVQRGVNMLTSLLEIPDVRAQTESLSVMGENLTHSLSPVVEHCGWIPRTIVDESANLYDFIRQLRDHYRASLPVVLGDEQPLH